MQLKELRIAIFCFFALLLTSCASSPYIGKRVDMDHPSICDFGGKTSNCSCRSNNFDLDYGVSQTGNPDEYSVIGYATRRADAPEKFTEFSNATFTLLLIDSGVVVETIVIEGGQGSFSRPIHFSRIFTTKKSFKSTFIDYYMEVQG